MDYLLSLSDAAKDKLGDEIVNDDTVSDNQQQGSGNVDTAAIPDAPDAPDYKKDIYNKYTSNNNNNSDDNTVHDHMMGLIPIVMCTGVRLAGAERSLQALRSRGALRGSI